MKKLLIMTFFVMSAIFIAQEKKIVEVKNSKVNATQNVSVDGAKLSAANKNNISKIKKVITDFTAQNLFCDFLKVTGNNRNLTAVPTRYGCFTWVFSKNGKVTTMQTIQGEPGKSYNAYSSDGTSQVGISCACL